MGAFVISKRVNGAYKFIFASRKGKTIFTSLTCKQKSDCEEMIQAFQTQWERFTLTQSKASGGKFIFRVTKDGLVLATSRKYTTERLLQKGIEEIARSIAKAEVLDFSDQDTIFPDAAMVFAENETQ
jgi:uncharacterized protein YegP (UPF0339 family)